MKADASNGYRLWITAAGYLQFEVRIAGTTHTVTSVSPIPLNTWEHIAAWYNGFQIRVYMGRRVMGAVAAHGALGATAAPLWLGYYDGASHHFHGYLDDVSIYSRALPPIEVGGLVDNPAGRYEHHHTNALGSNIVLTDEGKNVIARYEYDVFGAVRHEVGTSDNPRKFTGKEYESDVKLYYFAARYYDPYIGRFTQRDPAGDGINWYAYAYNNPLAFIDPTGMYIVLPDGAEIRSVPGKDADGNYVRPEGLSDDGGLVWDAIFTGGINGTGIAGSGAAGGILTDIIESDVQVNISFEDPQPGADADTDPSDFHNSGITVRIRHKPNADFVSRSIKEAMDIKLTMELVHEFSHVHSFITYPHVFLHSSSSYDKDFYLYVMELMAFDLGARFAIENMHWVRGKRKLGLFYVSNSRFTEGQLNTYGSADYYRRLVNLAGTASGYFPR